MSRRSPRYRVRFAATVEISDIDHMLVCHTRDISAEGCFLETSEMIASGVTITIALMDNQIGQAVQAEGVITRVITDSKVRGIGVLLSHPATPQWREMVQRYELSSETSKPPAIRLQILVVGDESKRRSALALYVTSGWDVRFATDTETANEALNAGAVDAVIAELPLDDPRWQEIMTKARISQPTARRIVRTQLTERPHTHADDPTLVHRFLDFNSGLDALVDALTAPIDTATAQT